MTDKENTKYNTVISEQPYIYARWSIVTFPGRNEPRLGHGTPWVNSGTIPAIPGRFASLFLGSLNFGLANAFRKATTRDEWRHIVDTTTLQRSTL